MTLGILYPFSNPILDVTQPVAKVLANPEAGWTFATVSPGVQRRQGYVEVDGQLPWGQQPIDAVHASIVNPHPFTPVALTVQFLD
jgi:hypothetical protein